MTTGVLFVCLGNICRSPTAQAVFEARLADAGLQQRFVVDSAGIGDWHAGRPPDARARDAGARRGYWLDHLRARQVEAADFARFDYILAMDRSNLTALEALRPAGFAGELALLLHFAEHSATDEVPDPYFGGADGFDRVIDLIEQGVDGLLEHIRAAGAG